MHTNPVRRMKTYTGGQGYVYQYYFVGNGLRLWKKQVRHGIHFRRHVRPQDHIFGKLFSRGSGVESWAKAHGRSLTDAERYGAVKMRLFEASIRSKT